MTPTQPETEATPKTADQYRAERYDLMSRSFTFGTPEHIALVIAESQLISEAVALHGVTNPDAPDCYLCRIVSVFGGPGHSASLGCKSGGYPHCTCDLCF